MKFEDIINRLQEKFPEQKEALWNLNRQREVDFRQNSRNLNLVLLPWLGLLTYKQFFGQGTFPVFRERGRFLKTSRYLRQMVYSFFLISFAFNLPFLFKERRVLDKLKEQSGNQEHLGEFLKDYRPFNSIGSSQSWGSDQFK